MKIQLTQCLSVLSARFALHLPFTQTEGSVGNKKYFLQKVPFYFVLPTLLFFTTAAYAQFDIHKLERLFTNAKQRQQIDNQRHGHAHISQKRKWHKVTLNGYMQRSDGENVVWVNGVSTLNQTIIAGVKVEPGSINGKDQVTVRINGKAVKLRPGESWRPSTRKINRQ